MMEISLQRQQRECWIHRQNLEGSCADILDEIYKTAKTDDDYFSYTDDFENVEITEAEEENIF